MTDPRRLRRLLQARHPCVSLATTEESYALQLVRDAALGLGRPALQWSASVGVRDALIAGATPMPGTESLIDALRALNAAGGQPVWILLDAAEHLSQARTLRALRDAIETCRADGRQIVLIDATEKLPPAIRAHAASFEISLPDEAELEDLLRETLRDVNRDHPIVIDIPRSSLSAIVRNLRGLSRRQARQVVIELVSADRRLDADDVGNALAAKRRSLMLDGPLEYIETPASLDEIGGLRRLKEWLQKRERAHSDAATQFGLSPPRGVLMLGVQGAGKSLCAKAIAAAWQRPLLRLDVGSLYDKYVGETEARLRAALRQAEHMAPLILWIDEIEKAFASAAAQSSDGGLSKRMFGALLTWMQDHDAPVFLVATANDIEALPPELLRKGRFDEVFFVDLPAEEARRDIFAIHLRKRGRDPGQFDLAAAAAAADGFSGAEIEQAVVSALYDAFASCRPFDDAVLRRAIESSPPLSITAAERVAWLRQWAWGRCVPAD